MLKTVAHWLDQKTELDQQKSEALIALLTLLYQADGKIRWQEQDVFARLLADLPWRNRWQSKEAYHAQQISHARAALQSTDLLDAFIDQWMPVLQSDGSVLALLRELAIADGELDPREVDVLTRVISRMR